MTSTRLDHDSRARRIAAIRFPLAIPVLCAVSARTDTTSTAATPSDLLDVLLANKYIYCI